MSRMVGACIRKAADMRTDPANWAAVTMGRPRRHAQRSPLAGLRSPGCPAGGTRVTFDSAASRHIVEVSRLFTWRLAMAACACGGGAGDWDLGWLLKTCLLYTSPSPRDGLLSR